MKMAGRIAALTCSLLLSCGGGTNVATTGGGVGTGGTGIVQGSVTGLGSVIVDGVRYDESKAAVEALPDLRTATPLALADLHVGQSVSLETDASGTVTRVRVRSQLAGPVGTVDAVHASFTVWGQQVTVNADPGQGPVTVFSGLSSLADLRAGDPVQVYGALQPVNGSDVIHATRIERITAGSVPARVTGTVQAGPSGAPVLAGRALDLSGANPTLVPAAGQAIVAVVPWNTSGGDPWRVSAAALLVDASATDWSVSGNLHLLGNGQGEVRGQVVDLSHLPATTQQQLVEGAYVTLHAQGSARIASAVDFLPAGGRPAELRGSIGSVTGTTFTLRGEVIDAANAQFTGGSFADLVAGRYVEVEGTQSATGVLAHTIEIPQFPPEGAVVTVTGGVENEDGDTKEVTVGTSDGRTLVVSWPAGAAWPANGEQIQVTGYWHAGAVEGRDVGP